MSTKAKILKFQKLGKSSIVRQIKEEKERQARLSAETQEQWWSMMQLQGEVEKQRVIARAEIAESVYDDLSSAGLEDDEIGHIARYLKRKIEGRDL